MTTLNKMVSWADKVGLDFISFTLKHFSVKHFFLIPPFERFPLSFTDMTQTFCWWSYAKVKNCGSGRTPRKASVRNMPSGTRQQEYPSSMTRTMPWGTQSTLALRSGMFSLLYVFLCVCVKNANDSLMTWSTVLLWFSGQRVNTQRSRRMRFRPPMIPLENQNGEKDLPYTWRYNCAYRTNSFRVNIIKIRGLAIGQMIIFIITKSLSCHL